MKTRGSTYTRRHLVNNFSMAAYTSRWLIVVAKCWPNAAKAGRWRWRWMTTSLRRTRQRRRQGATLFAGSVSLSCHHCPQTTLLPASIASSWVAAAASRHCQHTARHSATARRHPQHPGDDVPPQRRLICRCLNFVSFLTSKEGSTYMRIDCYASIYITWIFGKW